MVRSSSNVGWGWSPIPCTSCSMFSVQVCFLSILFSVLSKGIRLCYMFHGGFYLDVYLSRVVRLVVSGSFINLPHYEAMSLGYGHQFERRITLVLVLRVIYQARILLGWLCYCYRIHKWKATWERLRSNSISFFCPTLLHTFMILLSICYDPYVYGVNLECLLIFFFCVLLLVCLTQYCKNTFD